jgi:hypothetical protein
VDGKRNSEGVDVGIAVAPAAPVEEYGDAGDGRTEVYMGAGKAVGS